MKCDFVEIPSTPVTRITADMHHVVSSKSAQDESNFTDIYHGRKKFATEASNFAFLKLTWSDSVFWLKKLLKIRW